MFIGQCIHDITTSYGLMVSLFLAGLVGGFTHCMGMCSPFVLAQMGDKTSLQKLHTSLLLPYHLGRMTTYVALAVLLSSVMSIVFVFSEMKAVIVVPLLMTAGIVFLVSAFPKLSALFPWVGNVKLSAPYKIITRVSKNLTKNPGVLKRYGLGVLLGFMPCGLVISALLASSTADNFVQSGVAMGMFTLGTMPALMMISLGGNALRHRYPRAIRMASQMAMTISSFWLFALAGMMVF